MSMLAIVRLPLMQWQSQRMKLSASVEIGPSYNKASAYTETPIEGDERNVDIENGQQWQMGYMIGISLSKQINSRLAGRIGYEYLNAGKAAYGVVSTSGAKGPSIKLQNNIILAGVLYSF